MNGPRKVSWQKKVLIAIPLTLVVMIGGIGAWIIPPDTGGCPPRPAGETRSFTSCFVQDPQGDEQLQTTILRLIKDVEDLGALICTESVHEVELRQGQQDTELKKATYALTKAREEFIKKAPEYNLVFDRVENGFEGLGLPIIHQWSVSDRDVEIEGRTFRPKNPDKTVALLKNIDKAQKRSPNSPHYFAILDKIKKVVKGGKEYWRFVLVSCL
jgi:hypothetical protein